MTLGIVNLLALARRSLDALRTPALEPFLECWPAAPEQRPSAARDGLDALPVLRWLPRIAAGAGRFDPGLIAAVCGAAPFLEWRQTYGRDEVGEAFLQNYGWSELLGPRGLVPSTKISCGVMVLGPNLFYPHHRHEAEEMYVPLSGTAAWLKGDALWRDQPPGTLIHHLSEEPHAMRTGEEPLLAMYLWRSENLHQSAHLDRSEV
jgi:hypothetical protein